MTKIDKDARLAAVEDELAEIHAEFNKAGAPPGQTVHGRLREWRRGLTKANEENSAALAAARAGTFRKLPPERESVTRKISIPIVYEPCEFCGKAKPSDTVDLYATVGMYADGQPGEVFLKMSKQGSTLSGLMDVFSVACSLALKQGVTVEKLCRKFRNVRFDPSGPTGQPDLGIVSSPIDAVFRWIEQRFLPSKSAE